MARITVAPPRTMSPPAYILLRDEHIFSFTTIVFFRPNSRPSILFGTSGLGETQMATITWSQLIVTVLPVETGLRRPDSSASPNSITSNTAAFT